MKAAQNQLPDMLQRNQETVELNSKHELTITARVIRTVYFETIVNMAFQTHHRAVQLQKMHGVDLGYLHHDVKAAQRMVYCIGNYMHQDLILRLKKSKSPVTLILDCGSDITNNHYMITYLSFIEDDKHTIMFYRNIELGVREDAKALFEALITQFTRDNIVAYMRTHIAALVTDGASGKLI